MPFSSPEHLRNQHQRLFTSTARDSAVEHLTHMDRLATTRLSAKTGIRDCPDVDFRVTTLNNERISLAMATKLRRECEQEEARIRHENDVLWRKLEVHASTADRIKHHVNLVPVEEKKPFAEQGSNVGARRKEAKKIAYDNETLMYAMATLSPTIRNDKIRNSVDRHNSLVKRISKFRPAPRYAGEEILFPRVSSRHGASPRSPAAAAVGNELALVPRHQTTASGSSTMSTPRRNEWRDVSPHDVRSFRRETDRKVRSVFLRNEEEVLQEARDSPKPNNVQARRQTWTELGMEMAMKVPAPPPSSARHHKKKSPSRKNHQNSSPPLQSV